MRVSICRVTPPPPHGSPLKQVLPCHLSADITVPPSPLGWEGHFRGREEGVWGPEQANEGTRDRTRPVAIPECLCDRSLAVTAY